jgi:alpha-tubulin suppressor-like RCC1 family protein
VIVASSCFEFVEATSLLVCERTKKITSGTRGVPSSSMNLRSHFSSMANHSILLTFTIILMGSQLERATRNRRFYIPHCTRAHPAFLSTTERVIKVRCVSFFSAAITSHGYLWMWGDNICGQLGVGHKIPHSLTPMKVPVPELFMKSQPGGITCLH